ncbi:MAG: NAD(+) kinase [Gammaproteobacteria bacterium]|nr:NAD(+) kinase [Gammaproteobacteria bacterium]
MNSFKNIAFLCNDKIGSGENLRKLYDHLQNRNYNLLLDTSCQRFIKDSNATFISVATVVECDLAIVIGGDGTLLSAARTLADKHVPLVGINLGRLGFLVDISPDDMLQYIDAILEGHYIAEERFLLKARISNNGVISKEEIAFNDIVVNNYIDARLIEFSVFVNDGFVSHERADGMIIATPTGSTAYALSSGGPILHPSLSAMTLVPICPHALNHRPLVVDANSKVSIEMDPRCETRAQVSFDGQFSYELNTGDKVDILRHTNRVKLLHPVGYDFFDILRVKLHWGHRTDYE